MKYINKIGVMLSAGLMLAAASCTDYSDYNTVPEDGNSPFADKTLWENISQDKQLTKIVSLAEKSNFVKTLNSARFYTLWAPSDDAFSDEEYQDLMSSDSATIVSRFFYQHMAEFNYPISASLDSTTIVTLNMKHHPFTQQSFDGYNYIAGGINLPASNGLIHKIDGMSEFHFNLYENIDHLEGCDQFKEYIQANDEEYLDLNASIVGPLKEGKQTYLDSVMKKRNTVITRVMNANLEDEDSTFCMLIPNDEAWTKAYDTIYPHYNYIPKLDYMDLTKKTAIADQVEPKNFKADKTVQPAENLQDSIAKRYIVEKMVFSQSSPYNQQLFTGVVSDNDTVYSTTKDKTASAQSILDHTVAINEMSNGMTRTIDEYPFTPWDSYNPVIVSRTPAAALGVKNNKAESLTDVNIPLTDLAGRDSLFSKIPDVLKKIIFPQYSRFFSFTAVDSTNLNNSTASPEFDYALRGVRSSTYRIYVVTVPSQVEFPDAKVKPYYLRFWLSYTDASNAIQKTILPVGKAKTYEMTTADGENPGSSPSETPTTSKIWYEGDPGKVNVFDLGEFTFPVCYDEASSDRKNPAYPSLMIAHTKKFNSNKLRDQSEQYMRIEGVYLIPKEYVDSVSDNQ